MKRILSLLLCVALLLALLSACQQSTTEPTSTISPSASEIEWTVSGLANIAFEHSGYEFEDEGTDNLEAIEADTNRDMLTVYLENAYGLQESWEDAALI